MSYKGRVYLAGPISGLSYNEAVDWHKKTQQHFTSANIRAFSPMRGTFYLKKEKSLSKIGYDDTLLSGGKMIVSRDRFDIQQADIVLMNLLGAKEVSIGSMIEIGWADAYRKPLIIVMQDDNIHVHLMLNEIAAKIVPDLDTAIDVAKKFLLF